MMSLDSVPNVTQLAPTLVRWGIGFALLSTIGCATNPSPPEPNPSASPQSTSELRQESEASEPEGPNPVSGPTTPGSTASDSTASRSTASRSTVDDAIATPSPTGLSTVTTVAIAPPLDQTALWTLLQQKEAPYFVLMRHALAPGTGDPAIFKLDDCSTQRNLSAAGRVQAEQTGDAFRQQNVAVDRVLSSQWCRCLDTATLMDVGAVESFPPINSFFRDRSTEPEQTAQVQALMLTQQGNPGVTVMVTHFVNVSALSGIAPGSGEMVVMRLNGQNQLEVLGAIAPL